jgi:hypothetical protein
LRLLPKSYHGSIGGGGRYVVDWTLVWKMSGVGISVLVG